MRTPTDAELAAYVAGHLSSAREFELDRWMASDRANADRAARIRAILAAPTAAAEWDRARMWIELRRAMDRDEPDQRLPSGIAARTARVAAPTERRTLAVARVAAAVVAITAGGLYLRHVVPWSKLAGASQAPAHEYVTHRGERATVQLADGSRVTLAPESRLLISAKFGARERSVQLEGEAEFDVIHDSTRQFSVRAGRALVVDIGTRFDLRAYAGDGTALVAVADGAVTLASGAAPTAPPSRSAIVEGLLVRRGEVGRLDVLGHASTARIESDDPYFAWTEGRLVFEREPLRDVLGTIARWFDVIVIVPDPAVADRLVTGEFSSQAPEDMIRALARAVNASVVGSGRTLTLVSR